MKRRFLALSVVVVATAAGCADNQTGPTTTSSTVSVTTTTTTTIAPTTTFATTTAPATTVPTTTAPATTAPPTTVAPTTSSIVAAPPGRLPPVDVTGEITALFPAPFSAATSLELANEVNTRLRSSFETTGFSADVGGVSLVPYPSDGDDAMALVIEVRNREDSADDTSPGYDLVVVMRPDQTGSWAVTSATRQTICRRGVASDADPPVCI